MTKKEFKTEIGQETASVSGDTATRVRGLRNVAKIAVASLAVVCIMFSGCDKDKKDDDNGGAPNNVKFGVYSMPTNIKITWSAGMGSAVVTKVGNDYYSDPAGVLTTRYYLKHDPATKTWQEYSKPYLQSWAALETYTATTIKERLKNDLYFGFVLGALDNTGFKYKHNVTQGMGVTDVEGTYEWVSRQVTVFEKDATMISIDNQYGFAVRIEGSGIGTQSVSGISAKADLPNGLP